MLPAYPLVPRMIDISLPSLIKPKEASATPGLYLHDHHRATPSPRYRITLETNLISLIVVGRKSLTGPEQSGCYDAGTCILFRKGHCISADLCPDEGGYHSLLFFFDESVVDAFRHKYRDLLEGPAAPASQSVGLPFTGDPFVAHFAQGLAHSLATPGGLSMRQQHLRFEEIFLHLVEREGRRIVDFLEGGEPDDADERLRRVVQQHALANLTVEDLAFLCHLSLATFKRRFTRIFGTSPGQWHKARLLEHAARLLREQRLDPGEVSQQVGYSSPSSFTKAFREFHRMTPKRYQTDAHRSPHDAAAGS